MRVGAEGRARTRGGEGTAKRLSATVNESRTRTHFEVGRPCELQALEEQRRSTRHDSAEEGHARRVEAELAQASVLVEEVHEQEELQQRREESQMLGEREEAEVARSKVPSELEEEEERLQLVEEERLQLAEEEELLQLEVPLLQLEVLVVEEEQSAVEEERSGEEEAPRKAVPRDQLQASSEVEEEREELLSA